jgi:hypothetical protein
VSSNIAAMHSNLIAAFDVTTGKVEGVVGMVFSFSESGEMHKGPFAIVSGFLPVLRIFRRSP